MKEYNAKFSLWREKWKIVIAFFFLLAAISSFATKEGASGFVGTMIFVVIIVVWAIIDFKRYKLTVTDITLSGRESIGFFGKVVTLPIKQISAVEIEQKGIIAKIANYGVVKVTTSSGIVAFAYVKQPKEVQQQIISRL